MPEPDPKAGRAFIWTISCILFISIAAGGGCLLAYLTVPESQSSILLPALGFVLVCMPWIFWIITVVYRITSRAFGFRMVIGNLYGNGSVAAIGAGNGGGGGGGSGAAADLNDIDGARVLDVDAKSPPTSSENDGRHAQFGEAKNGDDISRERNIKRAGSSSSRSSNDMSVTSHESEMPLALSMTS